MACGLDFWSTCAVLLPSFSGKVVIPKVALLPADFFVTCDHNVVGPACAKSGIRVVWRYKKPTPRGVAATRDQRCCDQW